MCEASCLVHLLPSLKAFFVNTTTLHDLSSPLIWFGSIPPNYLFPDPLADTSLPDIKIPRGSRSRNAK